MKISLNNHFWGEMYLNNVHFLKTLKNLYKIISFTTFHNNYNACFFINKYHKKNSLTIKHQKNACIYEKAVKPQAHVL